MAGCLRADGQVYYDGCYDGYYGPMYDGYWGNDNFFYYSNDPWRSFVRDERHYFQRGAATVFHAFHQARNGVLWKGAACAKCWPTSPVIPPPRK